MSYTSPFLNPQPHISNLNRLSQDGVTLDEGVARGVREAAEAAKKYSADFALAALLHEFNQVCTSDPSDHQTPRVTIFKSRAGPRVCLILEMLLHPSRPGYGVCHTYVSSLLSDQYTLISRIHRCLFGNDR